MKMFGSLFLSLSQARARRRTGLGLAPREWTWDPFFWGQAWASSLVKSFPIPVTPSALLLLASSAREVSALWSPPPHFSSPSLSLLLLAKQKHAAVGEHGDVTVGPTSSARNMASKARALQR